MVAMVTKIHFHVYKTCTNLLKLKITRKNA
jgi:hypothetical protein